MNRQKLHSALKDGVVSVRFTKANSITERQMRCTLDPEAFKDPSYDGTGKTPNPDICTVWDVEKDGWRSFRYNSVIEWWSEAA